MPGKKAHKPKSTNKELDKSNAETGGSRKSAAQTPGHYERDPKRRKGKFSGAGDAPRMNRPNRRDTV